MMNKNKIPIHSSTGNKIEVGKNAVLTASDYSGEVTWVVDPGSTHLIKLTPQGAQCVVEGIGFGKVTLKATADDGKQTSDDFILYVGSVVIAGADGSYWQLTSDGQAVGLTQGQLSNDIKQLVKSNAIIADLTSTNKAQAQTPAAANTTPEPPSEAVTCYVLNLMSFTLK